MEELKESIKKYLLEKAVYPNKVNLQELAINFLLDYDELFDIIDEIVKESSLDISYSMIK